MKHAPAIDRDLEPREALCPRCGADAKWSFADREKTVVEIVCPDCGRFELPRAEFDQAELDIATPDERT
jgi:rubredoxin